MFSVGALEVSGIRLIAVFEDVTRGFVIVCVLTTDDVVPPDIAGGFNHAGFRDIHFSFSPPTVTTPACTARLMYVLNFFPLVIPAC